MLGSPRPSHDEEVCTDREQLPVHRTIEGLSENNSLNPLPENTFTVFQIYDSPSSRVLMYGRCRISWTAFKGIVQDAEFWLQGTGEPESESFRRTPRRDHNLIWDNRYLLLDWSGLVTTGKHSSHTRIILWKVCMKTRSRNQTSEPYGLSCSWARRILYCAYV